MQGIVNKHAHAHMREMDDKAVKNLSSLLQAEMSFVTLLAYILSSVSMLLVMHFALDLIWK